MSNDNSKYKKMTHEEFKKLDLSTLSKEEFLQLMTELSEIDVHAENTEQDLSPELPNTPPWIHFT